MPTATTDAIVREVRIEAPPEVVYSYFTEPEKLVLWMGQTANLDPRPGGAIQIEYNGFDRMSGRFLELVPHSRIVFSWGWLTLGEQTPPGASTVEVTLMPVAGGTMLKLVHSGLEAHETQGHAVGWDHFLPQLPAAVATGADAQPAHDVLNAAQRYASRLNAILCDLRYLLESAPEERWHGTAPASGWSAAATAMHAVSHSELAFVAAAIARNEPSPLAKITQDQLDAGNAQFAASNAAVPRAEVLAALREKGQAAVEAVKSIAPDTLSNGQPLAVMGGASVTAEQLLQGPLLANLEEHIADVRAALA